MPAIDSRAAWHGLLKRALDELVLHCGPKCRKGRKCAPFWFANYRNLLLLRRLLGNDKAGDLVIRGCGDN
jgi:hypothetical protein